jgi:hypothetical protein
MTSIRLIRCQKGEKKETIGFSINTIEVSFQTRKKIHSIIRKVTEIGKSF